MGLDSPDQCEVIEMCAPQPGNVSTTSSADCCVRCGRLIPSAFQIKNPGTDICDSCAAICVNVDLDEEER